MSFALDVAAFAAKAKKNPETVMRQTSIKLFSAIILASPVDTGRFRMNWQAAGGSPRKELVAGEDLTGAAAISRAEDFITKSLYWEDFTLSNNLPYANVIEYGGYSTGFQGPPKPEKVTGSRFVGPLRHKAPLQSENGYSKQAPQGVVRVNVARFNTLLAEEAAKLK